MGQVPRSPGPSAEDRARIEAAERSQREVEERLSREMQVIKDRLAQSEAQVVEERNKINSLTQKVIIIPLPQICPYSLNISFQSRITPNDTKRLAS